MTISNLLDKLLFFESDRKLFDIRVNDVYLWQYLRHNIFEEILIKYKYRDRIPSSRYVERWELNQRQLLQKETIGNVDNSSHRDVLIIPHGRRFLDEDGFYKCIYTDLLSKNIADSYYLLDTGDIFRGFLPINNINVLYMDIPEWKQKNNIKSKTDKRLDETIIEERIIKPIEEFFNIRFSDETIYRIKRESWICVSEYPVYISYYKWLLKKIKPKIVLIVCYYSLARMTLCEIAKEEGIPVVELQHGFINSVHIDYNFLRREIVKSFPDYIFLFGEYGKKARFPIDKDRIISVGFPELEQKISHIRISAKREKKVLFISSISYELAVCANELSKMLEDKDYSIIFKTHPLEVYNWKSRYSGLLDRDNIKVECTMEKTVYDLLNEVDWVVGVGSTSIYEATAFNVRIAVMKMNDYYYLSDLYESGDAILVENASDLCQKILSNTSKTSSSEMYYRMNSINNMVNELHRIMENGRKEK